MEFRKKLSATEVVPHSTSTRARHTSREFLIDVGWDAMMENEEESRSLSNEKIFKIFSSFMARITKFEELVDVGNKYLIGFQQGLEFLRRPPIDMTSEMVKRVLKANMTRRMTSYVQAGCMKPHDSKQNMNK